MIGFEPSDSSDNDDTDEWTADEFEIFCNAVEKHPQATVELMKGRSDFKRPQYRQCVGAGGGDSGRCCMAPALPYTSLCRYHIGQSGEQQLFRYCSHPACFQPTFDPLSPDRPFCAQHANERPKAIAQRQRPAGKEKSFNKRRRKSGKK